MHHANEKKHADDDDIALALEDAPVYRSVPMRNFPDDVAEAQLARGFNSLTVEPVRSLAGAVEEDYHSHPVPHDAPTKELSAPGLSGSGYAKPGLNKQLYSSHQVYREVEVEIEDQTIVHLHMELIDRYASMPSKQPPFFDRTSFFCKAPPKQVLITVVKSLHQNPNVDFTLRAQKHKLKGVLIQNGYAVVFSVKVFAGGHNRCLTEFQRRWGDVVQFHRFFCSTAQNMKSLLPEVEINLPGQGSSAPASAPGASDKRRSLPKAVEGEVHSAGNQSDSESDSDLGPDNAGSSAPLPPPLPGDESSVQLDAKTVRALMAMAVGPNASVQREALRSLAWLSNAEVNQHFLASGSFGEAPAGSVCSTLLELLETVLASKDWEVTRCGATLLAALAKDPSFQKQLIARKSLLDVIFTRLACTADLDEHAHNSAEADPRGKETSRETKRQLGATIYQLAQSSPAALLEESWLNVLRQHAKSSMDARLRAVAAATLLAAQQKH